jgi:hypothetical protein
VGRAAAEHERDGDHAGQVAGAHLVEEQLEQPGVGGLVRGAGDDGDVGRRERLDRRADRGVAPAEQARTEVDHVDDDVRRGAGEPLDHEFGRGAGAGPGLGVADDGDRAHARQ